MKRFLVSLLAIGLILAIGMPAVAQVKFSGQYTYEGWYESNRRLAPNEQSTGFQDHTLLLNAQFKAAEGLTLYTRARINDKVWGDDAARDRVNNTGRYLRENIEFDYLYMRANLGPGFLQIGSAPSMLGTPFLDTDNPTNQFGYAYTGLKGWYFAPVYEKYVENEVTNPAARTFGNATDADKSRFKFTLIKFGKTWDTGFTAMYFWDRVNRPAGNAYADYFGFDPYFRGTFGPLYVEAEGYILYGKTKYEPGFVIPGQQDVDMNGYSAYAKARYTFGPAYVGAAFSWVSGRGSDADKSKQGAASGREFKPALILLNPDRDKWLGALGTASNGLGNQSPLGDTYVQGAVNYQMYQAFVGFKPMPKLELVGTYSYAKLDKKDIFVAPATVVSYVDDELGHEVDLTATYKLYDNLSYMVGFGYLWTGDAFKGTAPGAAANVVENDWLLMHKLSLTF